MLKNPVKSWDPTWERVFRSQEWGKYPPEELVRFVARNYYSNPDRSKIRMLDLGCGTGAATWYLAREGFSAFGMDGSRTAIERAKARFRQERLPGEFRVGDFVQLPYPDASFDCAVDVVALQHNPPDQIARALAEVRRVLKPGGRIFSMLISRRSRFLAELNPLKDKGFVHFFDKSEVKALFSSFRDLAIETSERTDRGIRIAHFVVMART